jgi:hypothetical protein
MEKEVGKGKSRIGGGKKAGEALPEELKDLA